MLKKNFNLKPYNSYGIEAFCAKAYFPESEKDLIGLFKKEKEEKFIVLGNGNNIILSRPYYKESFIILNGCINDIKVKENIIEAGAGATILQVSERALENSLTGAEFYYDIPSSVGGAVVMNAGTKEGETQNILARVRYLDLQGYEVKEKENEEIQFGYRTSFFQQNKDKIILRAWFKLDKGNKKEIASLMKTSKERRWSKQPREFPNCGSVFKRPPGRYVGPMLDELGLKGFAIGDAQVSEKHSGFIVNKGKATGNDILNLIKEIQLKVLTKFGVLLEVEQRVI